MKKIKRIPYMGSKNKIAGWVCSNILENLDPKKEYDFLDIFGGGGSVTTTMAEQLNPFNNIYYNEKNEAVFKLFTLLVNGNPNAKKEFLEECLKWVSREKFKKEHIGTSAYAGYLQTCWTFGNNQKNYLYGRKIEQVKKDAHNIIINLSKETALKYGLFLDYSFYNEPLLSSRLIEYRKAVRNQITSNIIEKSLLYKALGSTQHIDAYSNILNLSTIQPNIIKTTNLDYKGVKTKPNTVIYCDAPYAGTTEYKEGEFSNEEYLNWLQELTKKNIPVFVSEYNLTLEGFKEIGAVKKPSLLSTDKTGSKMERLYWNGVK